MNEDFIEEELNFLEESEEIIQKFYQNIHQQID